tara:strand:+ start:1914 stop:3242 length:1329 start_codon:yes stop_codon:yes gene_type:complete
VTGLSLLNIPPTSAAMDSIWCDETFLNASLEIERSWVMAAIAEGFAPDSLEAELDAAIERVKANPAPIFAGTLSAGRPVAPLVDELLENASQELQQVLHLGLTTQDIIDGALTLLRGHAIRVILADAEKCRANLQDLAARHSTTVMLGRTNLQAASPITFGLFVAEGCGELQRNCDRIRQRHTAAQTVTLSGAVGLSAPFAEKSDAVRHRAAADLGLSYDPKMRSAPRDHIIDLLFAAGLLAKGLGRMARSISHLQSDATGELAEARSGGSSAMPHKQNPRLAERIIMLSGQVDGILLNLMNATQTLHQRSGDSWMAEWVGMAAMFQCVHAQILSFLTLTETLVVEQQRMRDNLNHHGLAVLSDRLFTALSAAVGRHQAKPIVKAALAERISIDRLIAFLEHHVSPQQARTIAAACSLEAIIESAQNQQACMIEDLEAAALG